MFTPFCECIQNLVTGSRLVRDRLLELDFNNYLSHIFETKASPVGGFDLDAIDSLVTLCGTIVSINPLLPFAKVYHL